MSEYQKQKAEKPMIEEFAAHHLAEPFRNNVLAFVHFLRENKMAPQWASTNSYKASCRSRGVCIIKLSEHGYQVWLNTQYNEEFNACFADAPVHVKTYLLDHMVYCSGCGSCKPGRTLEVLGVPQKKVCCNPVIRMENPDAEMLALAEKLVLLRQQAIKDGKAPKVSYIAKKKR